ASLTSPAAGAVFTAPASIAMTATASDSDGTITKVEFFQGATKLGQDTTSPYAFTWSSAPAGNYSLTAVATDNTGLQGTSAAVPIAVATAVGTGNGLKGEYFSTQNLNPLVFVRTDPTVDFAWGSGSPDPRIAVDNFSVRWSGQVEPRFTETYTFYTQTDDGV